MPILGIGSTGVALVALNFTDYITGIVASKYRQEHVTSCKGFEAFVKKKIGMWILIGVGLAHG